MEAEGEGGGAVAEEDGFAALGWGVSAMDR